MLLSEEKMQIRIHKIRPKIDCSNNRRQVELHDGTKVPLEDWIITSEGAYVCLKTFERGGVPPPWAQIHVEMQRRSKEEMPTPPPIPFSVL